ncbi:hypothetical protein J7E71_13025 [Mesobacillus foraminis]|uniref:group II intron maturase-specific domain-containing protein n=1 Tax=Mesobacillus foraminis TaxID=279826 RepID=UPI001BEBD313|nr:group II intron maturase-specific domain-containing protein [Mesobacillus foraminis]MBT2756870.1 hypothetical protein [Mesobacillus foraminis]
MNHGKLMSLIALTISHKSTLKLIRGYLQAGVMEDGVVSVNREGTPQGGPLSPLLKAGERVKQSVTNFIEKKLKLKVNEEKSAVGKPVARIFFGMSFYSLRRKTRVYVPSKSKQRFEVRLRKLTNRNWGVSMEVRIHKLNQLVQGWGNYFKIADIKKYAKNIDFHIRRRLRACRWKEWKKTRTK